MSDLRGGDVIQLGDRLVRIQGVTPIRNWRGAIAVRNVGTNRLSYVTEDRLRRGLPQSASDPMPELLKAAKRLLNVLNDDLDSEQCAAWDALNDAIAKAEGR